MLETETPCRRSILSPPLKKGDLGEFQGLTTPPAPLFRRGDKNLINHAHKLYFNSLIRVEQAPSPAL